MSYKLPPLVKDAKRLLLEIEKAVPTFPQSYKHILGGSLRKKTLKCAVLSAIAARDKGRRIQCLMDMDAKVEEIKLLLEVGQQLNLYSFRRFEELHNIAANVGRQCGGWRQHLMGQNPVAQDTVRPERARLLSNGDASAEASV